MVPICDIQAGPVCEVDSTSMMCSDESLLLSLQLRLLEQVISVSMNLLQWVHNDQPDGL